MNQRASTFDGWRSDAARLQEQRDALASLVTRADAAVRFALAAHIEAMTPVLDALDGLLVAAAEELGGTALGYALDEAVLGDAREWALTFLEEARALTDAPDDDEDVAERLGQLASLAQLEREDYLVPAARAAQGLPGMSREPRVARRLDRLTAALTPVTIRRAA